MGNARGRDQFQHAFDKCHAGAQDRGEHKLLADDPGGHHARHRGIDFDEAKREIACHLVAHQNAEFAAEFAKRLGRPALVAQQRQLVLNQRMPNDRHAFHQNSPMA